MLGYETHFQLKICQFFGYVLEIAEFLGNCVRRSAWQSTSKMSMRVFPRPRARAAPGYISKSGGFKVEVGVHELYLQGRAQQPAVDIAKSFERRKCNHKEAIRGDECLQSVIGSYSGSCRRRRLSTVLSDNNKHRYIVATQLQPIHAKLLPYLLSISLVPS